MKFFMNNRDNNLKSLVLRLFGFTAILIFTLASAVFAQDSRPNGVKSAEKRVETITRDSGIYFKQGLLYLVDRRDSEARKEFDKSVEIFLLSGINVKRNQKLRECYNQLIETIYRIEFPKNQSADVRGVSAVCGWTIRGELADRVANRRDVSSKKPNSNGSAPKGGVKPTVNLLAGFSEQKFEASPLDELSKLEFTETEADVNSPEARQEYQVLRRVAETNRSLGFRFQMSPKVQQFLNYYRSGRGRRTMEIGLTRSGMFMSMARRIFREEGVPENVAWLGQVESAWKPTAHSWAAAAGLWQFIPGTGRRFGLRRTAYLDERQSFEKATRASARYLKFLANRYGGNWALAMGAYNCGEGNVDRAIRKAGKRNFWAAYRYLPRETRNYVPNILAVIIVANNPYKYGFGHVRPAPPLRYDRVRIPASTNLRLIAQASRTTVHILRYLNPELRTNRTPPEPYVIRVPAGSANKVVAIFRRMPRGSRNIARLANSSRGETWRNLSRRTGVSVADLRGANPGMKVPRGRVIVPTKGNGIRRTSYSRRTKKIFTKGCKSCKS